MYATIAVGTDESETASIAERVALELARTSAGRVLCLSVYEDEPGMQRSAEIVKAASARAEAAGVAVDSKTMRAEPAEGIVELADRGEAGLLVLGCTVGWNHRAKTWDCPCHGSRYESDGTVKNGPTRHPLDPVEIAT